MMKPDPGDLLAANTNVVSCHTDQHPPITYPAATMAPYQSAGLGLYQVPHAGGVYLPLY